MSLGATGLRAWLVQRISAVYLAGYTLYLVWHFLFDGPTGYQAWREWLSRPAVNVGMLLFFAALLLHAWVGIRDVVMDYVHPLIARVMLLALLAAGLLGCGLWAARVLLGVY